MDSFVYVERHRTIICKTCKHAVGASQFQRHIQDRTAHSVALLDRETWRRVVEKFTALRAVNTKDIVIPSTTVRSIDGLDIYTDGFMCSKGECRFIGRKVRVIKRHCR